jgi:hypothetical protein
MQQAGQSILGDVRRDVGKVGNKGGEKRDGRREARSQDARNKR